MNTVLLAEHLTPILTQIDAFEFEEAHSALSQLETTAAWPTEIMETIAAKCVARARAWVNFAAYLKQQDNGEVLREKFGVNGILKNKLGETVQFRNVHWPDQYLKLIYNIDEYGDRDAWGGAYTNTDPARFNWILELVKFSEAFMSATFRIRNAHWIEKYLKLIYNIDEYGDRDAWGGAYTNADPDRFQWIITADSSGLMLQNAHWTDQYLKLIYNIDEYGDRDAWGGAYTNADPDRFKWIAICGF